MIAHIKPPEVLTEVLREICKEVKDAETMMDVGAQKYRRKMQALWESIYTEYPELKGFLSRYEFKNEIIVVTGNESELRTALEKMEKAIVAECGL